jgi:histidine ammonia-lyase
MGIESLIKDKSGLTLTSVNDLIHLINKGIFPQKKKMVPAITVEKFLIVLTNKLK